MEAWFGIGLVVGILSLITVIALVALYLERKRTAALKAIAQQAGLSFATEEADGFVSAFGDLHLFMLGRGRAARNVMRGEMNGVSVTLFDYRYVTGSGKSRSETQQTVVALSCPNLALPGFELRPENIFHKLGSALGFQDIDFPENPAFSSAFLLRGAEEQAVRKVFKPGVLSFLETRPGMCVEGRGRLLVYYRAGHRTKPEELQTLMNDGRTLAMTFCGPPPSLA